MTQTLLDRALYELLTHGASDELLAEIRRLAGDGKLTVHQRESGEFVLRVTSAARATVPPSNMMVTDAGSPLSAPKHRRPK